MLSLNLNIDTFYWIIMCALMRKLLKSVYTFCTKISSSINNCTHHIKKQQFQYVGDGFIIIKHYDACTPPYIELIDIL